MRRILAIAILLTICVMLTNSCSDRPSLLSPEFGCEVATNTPVLAWTGVDCDYYELWIDGVKQAVFAPQVTSCVPFPLSFGERKWKIKAIKGVECKSSDEGLFNVSDRTLNNLPESAILLRDHWYVASSFAIEETGSELSSGPVPDTGWAKTSVPATVLTALVRNGIYPNPYVGMNNMQIPDSDDEYNAENDLLKYSHIEERNPWQDPYWYRTSFHFGDSVTGNVLLTFEEFNYRAEVWLNGYRLSDSESTVGMERACTFNITDIVRPDDTNYLAVKIYPVDIPGTPSADPLTPLGDPGLNMGDGRISVNYTKWDTMGWDWQPPVRDRDMGITEEVYVHMDHGLVIDNIYVSASLDMPSMDRADVTISADVTNTSFSRRDYVLEVTVNGKNASGFELPVTLLPGQKVSFEWTKDEFPVLEIQDPELWWPNGYGTPYLYSLSISAQTDGKTVSRVDEKFGIRNVNTYIGSDERILEINGRRIYVRGGNWVNDMMLNWTASRYEKEILLSKNAGMNLIRVWGPTGVAPEVFYNAADKYGIMIWQDFLHDFWGTFKNSPGYRPDEELYREITSGIVRKYRNHPSLVMWCGGNEGVNPREDMIVGSILPELDGRDSRFYLRASDNDGLHGGGPYNTLQPEDYFTHFKLHGFSSEIGPSGVPVFESVCKTVLCEQHETCPGRFPLDDLWAFHDANNWPGKDARKFTTYDDMLRNRYGDSHSVSDYSDKAQMVNYDVYRASIEAINRQLWDRASGILLWKANSSWPSFTWQIYDWFLQAHAGYYGTKKAMSSIYVQWNRDDDGISVINMSDRMLENVMLRVSCYSMDGMPVYANYSVIDVGPDSSIKSDLTVKAVSEPSFLKLELFGNDGSKIAGNIYWLGPENDFTTFATLVAPELDIKVETEECDKEIRYTLNVKNIGDRVALMTEFKLAGSKSDCELLPSFWSDNFVTLMPGDSVSLTLSIFKEDIIESPVLRYRMYGMDREWKTVRKSDM